MCRNNVQFAGVIQCNAHEEGRSQVCPVDLLDHRQPNVGDESHAYYM